MKHDRSLTYKRGREVITQLTRYIGGHCHRAKVYQQMAGRQGGNPGNVRVANVRARRGK